MKRYLVFFLLFTALDARAQTGATISGRVINQTTRQPVKADWVVLVKTGQGLETVQQLERASDFHFKDVPALVGAPYLVRAFYDGVLYTENILVQESKEYVVDLSVYNATTAWEKMAVRVPHLIIVRNGTQLDVQETYEIQNAGQRTVRPKTDNAPTFRFQLPSGAVLGTVTTSHNQSMPVAVTVQEDGDARVISFPFRPGTTQIEVAYSLDYSQETCDFKHGWFYDITECNAFVSPANIRVVPEGFTHVDDAQMAASDFAVYTADRIKPGQMLTLSLSGGTSSSKAAQGGEQVVANPSDVQERIWSIVPGLMAVFMVVIYVALQKKVVETKSAPSRKDHQRVARQRRDLSRQQDSVALKIAELDARFENKTIAEKEYAQRRDQLKSQLRTISLELIRDADGIAHGRS